MSSAALPIRGNRRTEIGVVTSDKTTKTRRVEIDRLVPHPKYGKFQRRRTVAIAHDEEQISHEGDLVEVVETRPISKTMRWRVIRVIRPSQSSITDSTGS